MTLLEVAFANEAHARTALAAIENRPELFETVHACEPASEAEVVMVHLQVRRRNEGRILTLVRGLHGILVRTIRPN